MTTETILKFKNLFETQKRNLLYTARFMNDDFHFPQDEMADEADLTSLEMEASMKMRLRNRETLFLKKINEALKRIQDGSFGECESCAEQIELKRLEARPTTTLCVLCKEEEERREQIHADGHKHKSLGKVLRIRAN